MDAETAKPIPLLSRRLRRWQDARGLTNADAAAYLGMPLRTYTNALLAEHFPRGVGASLLSKLLTKEEKKLQLPPLQ